MKGICLMSGGLDSTLALLKLLEEGHGVVPMFVDYNQWPLEGELKSFVDVVAWVEEHTSIALVPTPVSVDWSEGPRVGSAWGRTTALAGLAMVWAYTHGDDYDFIAVGAHKGDSSPDLEPGDFDMLLNQVVYQSTKGKMELLLPIKDLDTSDIGMALGRYGVPWDLMYSCYWTPPCGFRSGREEYRCPGCRRKTMAMKAAGVTDEKLLDFPNGGLLLRRSYQSPLVEEVGY